MPRAGVNGKMSRVPFGGIFLVFLGVVFLLQVFGVLPWGLWGVLWRYWPVILIIIGLNFLLVRYNRWLVGLLSLAILFVCLGTAMWEYGGVAPSTRTSWDLYSQKLDGLEAARIEADFTALGVTITSLPGENPDLLWVQGTGAARGGTSVDFQHDGSTGNILIKTARNDWRFWQNNEEAGAAVRVSRDIPVTVDIKSSLSSLKVDMLHSSELRIDSSLGNVRLDMTHPEGNCEAYIHATMSNIEVTVPYDIAARFIVDSDFGSVYTDEAIFVRQDGSYVTRNFEQAADGLDVKIDSQFSRVKVSIQPVEVYISSAY